MNSLKKNVEPAIFFNRGKIEAGKDNASASTCKRPDALYATGSSQKGPRARDFMESTRLNFESAFNTMSQAALWQVMRMFNIPDVDLFEQIFEGTTIRLAPNNEESAKITFNTGGAQGRSRLRNFSTFSLIPCLACSR